MFTLFIELILTACPSLFTGILRSATTHIINFAPKHIPKVSYQSTKISHQLIAGLTVCSVIADLVTQK